MWVRRLLIGGGVAVGVLALGVAGLAVWGGPLADIRPPEIEVEGDQSDREAKGRALIDAALVAHGGAERWAAHRSQTVRVRDVWPGWYAAFSPWPAADITAEVVQRRHSFDSVVTFVDGPDPGLRWGVVDDQVWQGAEGQDPRWASNANAAFILPTTHYFMELPIRLPEAPMIRHVRRESIGGRDYEVVYVTWKSWSANPEYDQYLAYLDVQTGRYAKLRYTVREMGRFIEAVAHLDQHVEVDGLWFPGRLTVTATVDEDPDQPGWMHQMTFDQVRLDTDAAEDVLAARPGPTTDR